MQDDDEFDEFFIFLFTFWKNSYRIEFDFDPEKYKLFPEFFFILISQVLDISFIKVPITSFNGTEWYGKVKRKENDNLISE